MNVPRAVPDVYITVLYLHIFLERTLIFHMCYGPLKVSSEIALRKLNEQKDIFTIWENFVPGLFFQTAISRERNEIL